MRLNTHFISLLTIFSLMSFLHLPVTAGVIDQECVDINASVSMDPGFGQGFVPTAGVHVGIEIRMESNTNDPHDSATIVVHEETLNGPVVSGSTVTLIPESGYWVEWVPFAFDSPISLTPGNMYVVEVISDSNWLAMTAQFGYGGICYPHATAYKDGVLWEDADWNFRTWVYGSDTVEADIQCTPAAGTLPFTSLFEVTIKNIFSGPIRQYAARIDVTLGGGKSISNWKSGHTNLQAGNFYYVNWNQNLPHLAQLHGNNTFSLIAEDVTPAPYNQPPYQPAGDTDTIIAPLRGH